MRAKHRAPSRVRKQPEIFCLTLIMRMSCSHWLLVKGTFGSRRKASTQSVVVFETVEQVGGFVLFGAALSGLSSGMFAAALGEDALIFAVSLVEDFLFQAVPYAGIAFPVEQEAGKFVSPEFAALLEEELQFPQEVLVAERVEGVVFEIGFPEVVDEPGFAMGEDTKSVHGLGSPVAMHAEEGQECCGGDVKPVEFPFDAQAAFVGMNGGCLRESLDDGAFHGSEHFVGPRIDRGQRAQTNVLAEEIGAGLPQAVEGKDLLVEKIEQQASEVRAVLYGGFHVGGELRTDLAARDRAAFDFGAVLGDLQSQGRQIEDLASFIIERGRVA